MTATDADSPGRESVARTRAKDLRDVGAARGREHRGHAVVPLPGDIDLCVAGQVEASVSLALGDGAAVLVADASHTTFCDCAGVHALIRTHRRAAESGVQLRIAASPAMRRVLHLTGADHVLDTYSSVFEALAGTARRPASQAGDDEARAS